MLTPIPTTHTQPYHSDLAELHAVVARAHEEQGESMALLRSRIRARFLPQLRACFLRAARASWRMPEYQLARIGGTGALGLALGSLYWNMSQATVSGMVSFIALVFLATTFVSSINATSVLQTVALEKPSFARERFNRMYVVGSCVFVLNGDGWVVDSTRFNLNQRNPHRTAPNTGTTSWPTWPRPSWSRCPGCWCRR